MDFFLPAVLFLSLQVVVRMVICFDLINYFSTTFPIVHCAPISDNFLRHS